MQLNKLVAVLTATYFVAGCGFVPKQAPKPKDNARVPINIAAPFPQALLASTSPHLIEQALSLPAEVQITERSLSTISAPQLVEQTLPLSAPSPSEQQGLPAITKVPVESYAITSSGLSDSTNTDKPTTNAATPPLEEKGLFSPEDPRLQSGSINFELRQNPALESSSLVADIFASTVSNESPSIAATTQSFSIEQQLTDSVQTNDTPELLPTNQKQDTQIIRIEPDVLQVPKEEVAPVSADEQSLTEINDTTVAVNVSVITEATPEESPAPPMLTWSGQTGMTLEDMMAQWGSEENWTVHWGNAANFRIEADFSIQATDFLAAANHVFKLYERAGYTFTPLAHSNRVLRVTAPKD